MGWDGMKGSSAGEGWRQGQGKDGWEGGSGVSGVSAGAEEGRRESLHSREAPTRLTAEKLHHDVLHSLHLPLMISLPTLLCYVGPTTPSLRHSLTHSSITRDTGTVAPAARSPQPDTIRVAQIPTDHQRQHHSPSKGTDNTPATQRHNSQLRPSSSPQLRLPHDGTTTRPTPHRERPRPARRGRADLPRRSRRILHRQGGDRVVQVVQLQQLGSVSVLCADRVCVYHSVCSHTDILSPPQHPCRVLDHPPPQLDALLAHAVGLGDKAARELELRLPEHAVQGGDLLWCSRGG